MAAGTSTTSALAGCPDTLATTLGDEETSEPITPVDRSPSTPERETCGSASLTLPERLSNEAGDPAACFDGAEPGLAIENGRDETIDVAIALATETDLPESISLDAGERIVETGAFVADDSVTGTLTVGDEEWELEWTEWSCYRHGVAVFEDDIEIGWIEPIHGPGDTQHDCYPGTSIPLEVGVADEKRTVTVTVVDRCAESDWEETVIVAADDREGFDDVIESGGVYEVSIDVEDGSAEQQEFHDVCWGITASVDEDGEIRLHQIEID